ncbi:hypothetical protein ACKFKG_03710 [Phormidesmis sp. 146-35]
MQKSDPHVDRQQSTQECYFEGFSVRSYCPIGLSGTIVLHLLIVEARSRLAFDRAPIANFLS